MDDEEAYQAALDWDMSEEVAETILAQLTDPTLPEEERGTAAIRLGPFIELIGTDEIDNDAGERITEGLWAVHDADDQPELVRRRALEALVRNPTERVSKAVRRALEAGGSWRITGIFAAGFVDGFAEAIKAAVASDDVAEQLEGWTAAGNAELHELERRASQVALDDEVDNEIRVAAIFALETLDDDDGSGFAALDALQHDEDEEIRDAAQEAFAQRLMWQSIRDLEGQDDLDDLDDPEA